MKDQFVPWTWAQVSQGDGVYAYPQDAGPMIQMCNKALLDKHSIDGPDDMGRGHVMRRPHSTLRTRTSP